MLSQLHQAKSTFANFQRKTQMIADNIANANTVGFKRHDMNMESLFPLVLDKLIADIEDPNISLSQKRRVYNEYGSAIAIADITTDFGQGGLETTNRPLDFAINGKGFFQFRLPDGRLGYGRAGNLHIDPDGTLVDPNGHPIEPAVRLPRDTQEVIVNREGTVFVRTGTETTPREIGQITLANVPRPDYLKAMGQNMWLATVESGEPVVDRPGQPGFGVINQRVLETSNVQLIEEMMNLLMSQRSFQMNKGAVDAGQEMVKQSMDIVKG